MIKNYYYAQRKQAKVEGTGVKVRVPSSQNFDSLNKTSNSHKTQKEINFDLEEGRPGGGASHVKATLTSPFRSWTFPLPSYKFLYIYLILSVSSKSVTSFVKLVFMVHPAVVH